MDKRLWPRVERCPGCHETVVLARWSNGKVVVLDESPVIVGQQTCQWCRGKGQRTVPEYAKGGPGPLVAEPGDLAGRMTKGSMTSCPTCGGTGLRGEALTSRHVVMAIDGTLRHDRVLVASWDSAYVRHECPRNTDHAAHTGRERRANGGSRC